MSRFPNADFAKYIEERDRRHDAGEKLSAQLIKLIAQDAPEDKLLECIDAAPDYALDAGFRLAHLAAYGQLLAYDRVLQYKFKKLDEHLKKCAANGPVKPNIYQGAVPVSTETQTFRRLMDDLSYGMHEASGPAYLFKDGRKQVTQERAAANVEKALEMIVPHAERFGVDMRLAFPVSAFVIMQNYALAGVMQRISPAAFNSDHAYAEASMMQERGMHKENPGFYDDYMFQRDHGYMAAPVKPEYGYQLWPDNSPVMKMQTAYYEATHAGDEAGARAAFNGKSLRPTHCAHYAQIALSRNMPQLVLELFDTTTAFNKTGLAGYMLAQVAMAGLRRDENKQPNAVRDEAFMQVVSGLQARGGDINTHDGNLLMHIAQAGRMDIAKRLVDERGASIAAAYHKAKNYLCTDESGGSHEYPYADAARRLNNLLRSSKPRADKGNPAP